MIFATSAPTVTATAITPDTDAIAFTKTNDEVTVNLAVEPITATTTITWAATDDDVVTLTPSADGRSCVVKCIAESSDTDTITITAGALTKTIAVTATIA